jgi:hypothetical protein
MAVGEVHILGGKLMSAVSSKLNSGPSFFSGKFTLVDRSASLPSVLPLIAFLVALVGKPGDGLLGRRKRDPHTSILDHNGLFPTCHHHVRKPSGVVPAAM